MRNMKRFENHGFIITFNGDMEVVVTDKATGEVTKANDALAREMKNACIAEDRDRKIPEKVKAIWHRHSFDNEKNALQAKGYEGVYQCSDGPNGNACIYRITESGEYMVLCNPNDGDIFTMTFDTEAKAIGAANRFAGTES